jgi:hypothetical protein
MQQPGILQPAEADSQSIGRRRFTRDGALSNRLLSAGKWQKNSTRFCPAASQ